MVSKSFLMFSFADIPVQCGEGMIACRDGNGCVTTSELCDGRRQCNDGTDEDTALCTVSFTN